MTLDTDVVKLFYINQSRFLSWNLGEKKKKTCERSAYLHDLILVIVEYETGILLFWRIIFQVMATQEVRNQEKQPDAFAESSESFCVDFGLTTEITAHKAVLKKTLHIF